MKSWLKVEHNESKEISNSNDRFSKIIRKECPNASDLKAYPNIASM